jgi:starvation-inducible DNA-binding protein
MRSNGNQVPSADERAAVGRCLQALLTAVLDLGLTLKHLHWNVYGAGFRSLHLHLDELAAAVGHVSDELAERALAIGVSPDGRTESLARSAVFEPLPPGPTLVDEVTSIVARRLDAIGALARVDLHQLGELDPVSQDVVLGLLAMLERQHWMLMAEFSSHAPAVPR